MDWRSFSKAAFVVLVVMAGCGRNAVRAAARRIFRADGLALLTVGTLRARENELLTRAVARLG